jgi:DNA-binding GntR family transcriptional regulator
MEIRRSRGFTRIGRLRPINETGEMEGQAKVRAGTVAEKPARGDRVTAAYEQLRDLIIWGRLAPGTRIIETDVAARLGVSRTPVRSALQRLVQEGYIVASDGSAQIRLMVAPLTQDDARELFAILSEMEGLGAAWAAELPASARRKLVAELRSLNGELELLTRGPDVDSNVIFDLDQAFHRCFLEAGGGPRLRALHEAVKPQSARYIRLYVSVLVDQIHKSVIDHEAIAAAIEAGDAREAKEAVLRNWRNAGERLGHVIARFGERGIW